MKKILISIVLIVLLVSVIGCTQPTPNQLPPPKENQKSNEKDNENGNVMPEPTIKEILTKGTETENIEYEAKITHEIALGKQEWTSKIYQKETNYKTVIEDTGLIGIFNGTKNYTYFPEIDKYVVFEIKESSAFDAKYISEQALLDSAMKEIKKQRINGFDARIIEFTYFDKFFSGEKQKITAWISEEYGIPVKIETQSQFGPVGIEIRNIKLNSVKDTEFEVPEEKVITQEELEELMAAEE